MKIITGIYGNDISSLQTPGNRSDGSKCSGVEEILQRLREHYDQTLNHPSGTVCPELDATSSEATPDIDICTDEPTLDEVVRAGKKLKNGHAAGCDDIPPQLLKCALPRFSSIAFVVPVSGALDMSLWSGRMVSLFLCIRARDQNGMQYRPISSLLSVLGKVF